MFRGSCCQNCVDKARSNGSNHVMYKASDLFLALIFPKVGSHVCIVTITYDNYCFTSVCAVCMCFAVSG